jgi:small basic protein
MRTKLAIIGLLVGGVVGFLLRPNVPLMGQLPFTTVITRGSNLRGLDQLLLGYARSSFNYLVAGIIVGTLIGLIAAVALEKSQAPTGRRDSRPS